MSHPAQLFQLWIFWKMSTGRLPWLWGFCMTKFNGCWSCVLNSKQYRFDESTIQHKSIVLVSLFVNKKALVRWDFYILCFKNMVFFLTIPFEPCHLECVRAMVPFSHLSFVWDATRNLPWDRVLWGHWVLLHVTSSSH